MDERRNEPKTAHGARRNGASLPQTGTARERTLQKVAIRRSALDLAQAWSVIGIFTILAIGSVYLASAVLMPITLAIVVGLILGLAADRLGKLGVPPMLAALILSSLFAAIVFFLASAVIDPLSELAANAPAMLERPVEKILPYLQRFEWLHISSASLAQGPMSLESLLDNTGMVLSTVATQVTPALVQGLIFFAALLLFLGSRHQIRRALIIAFRDRQRRLSAIRTIHGIETALGFYFATASLLYAAVGISAALIAWIGGLSSPVLWGFLAFLSSFVPFLGVAGMTLALALAGLFTHENLIVGLAPATAFLFVHAVVENLVTPAVMGRRLEMNPFLIFVAIIFWTWMWGAVGAMLALPLSLIAMTVASGLLPQQRVRPKLPG